MARNASALEMADLALFRLDGTFTIGTPIEIAVRQESKPQGVAIWIDPDMDSLFTRWFARKGALVLRSEEEVKTWLRWASR